MLLSQTCEYTLRAVAYIAQHEAEGSVLAREIASANNIPLKYLQKILRELVRAGLLTSARGIGGGFRLEVGARTAPLAAFVAPFEDTIGRTTCPFGKLKCGAGDTCPIHDHWVGVVDAYRNFMEKTRVVDLIDKPPPKPKR